jgi:hypothetical protein
MISSRWLIVAAALLLVISPAVQAGLPTISVIYSGNTTIKDALVLKSTDADRATYISGIIGDNLKPIKFPYFVSDDKLTSDKTVIAVNGYRCNNATPPRNEPANTCGYWIAATKNKKEVQTNSPIWIYPSPYQYVTVATNSTANTVTYTISENPQAAFEQMMIEYVRSRPVGKATTGTPL